VRPGTARLKPRVLVHVNSCTMPDAPLKIHRSSSALENICDRSSATCDEVDSRGSQGEEQI
jgi:hypothetical protein